MIIISQARHKWMQVCHRILTQVDTSGHKWISMLMDMHAIIHHHSKRISCIQTSNAVCMATLAMQVFKRCDHFCSIKPVTNMKQYIKECFLSPNTTSTKFRTSVTCL